MTPPSLSPSEESLASRAWVHLVWFVYSETDETGEEVTWGIPLSIHADPKVALAEAAKRKGSPPPGAPAHGLYHVEGPCNLLALRCAGFIDEEVLRACLRTPRGTDLVPKRWYSPSTYRTSLSTAPLSSEECQQAAQVKVWTVYYEDQFHAGDARDSFPVSVCLSQAEADAEVARRGPLEKGYDGYLADGPSPLVGAGDRISPVGPATVREVLRRLARGEAGPVPVRTGGP